EFAELRRNLINPLLWRGVGRGGRALHMNAMLIGSRQKKGVIAEHPFAASDGVAHNRRVRVPDMRTRVHVKDRRRDVELLALIHCFFPGFLFPGKLSWLPVSPFSAVRAAVRRSSGNLRTREHS